MKLSSIMAGLALCTATLTLAETKTIRFDGFPDYDNHFKKGVSDQFQKENPNIKLKAIFNNHGDHHTKLQTSLATGAGAGDVVLVEVERLGAFVNGGGFVNLSQAPYSADKMASDFAPYAWSQGKGADGNQYGIPVDLGPGVLYYRHEFVKGMGYKISDIIKSWDSYIEWGKAVKKKHKNVALIADAANVAHVIIYATVKDGNGLFFDAKGKPLLTNDRFVKAFTLAKRVRDAGLDLSVEAWSNEWYEVLKKGKVATQLSGGWLLGHLKNWIAPKSAGQWAISNLPNGVYGSWGGSFLAIPKQSKHPKEAWKLISFLVSPKIELQGLKNIAAFPANIKTYNDPIFSEKIDYLGGQQARKLFAEIATQVPSVRPAKGDQIATTIVGNALGEVLDGHKTVKEALEGAQKMLIRRSRRFR